MIDFAGESVSLSGSSANFVPVPLPAYPPNIPAFILFLRNVVVIPVSALPNNATVIGISLSVAMDIVNITLALASEDIYNFAVYNLASDMLINYAQDLPNQTYFTTLRAQLNLSTISVGVVSSSGDQSTSVGLLNPTAMQNLTLQNLQNLKTPYGRAYLGFAQMYGSNLWGLS
ncbi:MAG: hypothetical protein ACRESI_06510 [Gammaproteobacteria bacterium]